MQTLQYNNTVVFYSTYGNPENPAVMLLHGYLESMMIWTDTARDLQDEFFVITPDIPGHGLSEVLSEVHTMEEMAQVINTIMEELAIQKVHLVGHSMGGYITLAFRELFPQKLLSFTLFHSHCFADPEEKKINREREIELIKSGKKELIINNHVPNLFADGNLTRCTAGMELVKKSAMETPDKGIIALLKGMKNRSDKSHLLKQGGIPGLLLTGSFDKLISVNVNDRIMTFAKDMVRVDLNKSGHMGMMEEKGKAVQELRNFFVNIKTSL